MRGTLLILILFFAAAPVQKCCTIFVRSCKAIVKPKTAQSQRPKKIDTDSTVCHSQIYHRKTSFGGVFFFLAKLISIALRFDVFWFTLIIVSLLRIAPSEF